MDKQANLAAILAFCGESGAGKSTIAKLVKECLEKQGFRAEFATKYISGRKQRKNEDPNVQIVSRIPKNCIKCSPRKGEEVGYDLRELEDMLSRGIYPIIISKDLKLLAEIFAVFNPEKPRDFETFDGKVVPIFDPKKNTFETYTENKLPVIRMRIYDVRSAGMTDAQMENLIQERNSNLERHEIDREVSSRKVKWDEYYRQRYGSGDILETFTNVKDYAAAEQMVKELIVGSSASDESTILGYNALWHGTDECYTAGVIVGQYNKLSKGVQEYLKKQEELELAESGNYPKSE